MTGSDLPSFWSMVIWSLLATVAMTTVLQGAQGMGLSRLSLPFLAGTLFTGDRRWAMVVGFAVLVAKDLSDVSTTTVVGVGLAGMAACLVVAGLLRHRWAFAVGSVLQVLLLLSGLVVPAMWFLGAVFGALWLTVLYLATRLAALPPVTR